MPLADVHFFFLGSVRAGLHGVGGRVLEVPAVAELGGDCGGGAWRWGIQVPLVADRGHCRGGARGVSGGGRVRGSGLRGNWAVEEGGDGQGEADGPTQFE